MELGADAVLLNTAIASSSRPELMASAMRLAVVAGRLSYLSSMSSPTNIYAHPSSPPSGLPF